MRCRFPPPISLRCWLPAPQAIGQSLCERVQTHKLVAFLGATAAAFELKTCPGNLNMASTCRRQWNEVRDKREGALGGIFT